MKKSKNRPKNRPKKKWSPSAIANRGIKFCWFDASSDKVSRWLDKSGNDNFFDLI